MRENLDHLEQYRRVHPILKIRETGLNGCFEIRSPFDRQGHTLKIVSSNGKGWDHVSVSKKKRCPTWEEMCFVKDLFFEEEEAVLQIHPPKSEYVNNAKTCLHLWRNQNQEISLPDSILVGFK